MPESLPPRQMSDHDQRVLAAASEAIRSLEADSAEQLHKESRRVLADFTLEEGDGRWISATADLNTRLTSLTVERPDIVSEPDGWSRVERSLSTVLTELTQRAVAIQLRLPTPRQRS